MKVVFLVSSENKNKAETALKGDDEISRGSITIREAKSLGFEENGIFFILDAPETAVKKAEELLKGLGKKYKKASAVIKKVEEQENTAIEGFGNILGG
ncbi:MAG: hypothetical protein NT129_03635 [Candidatus Aenigmarchaeota archaeon]|nr:hypothetical protein [Candidatus Aenigmarchaeota archaeon]